MHAVTPAHTNLTGRNYIWTREEVESSPEVSVTHERQS